MKKKSKKSNKKKTDNVHKYWPNLPHNIIGEKK